MIKKIKHKYGAIKCEFNGIKFSSKLEQHCYAILKNHQDKKEILFFLRQIPFDLPGNIRHFVDFQVFTPNSVIFFEAKGRDLYAGKMKRKQVENIYKIPIHVINQPYEIIELIKNN